MTAFNDTFLKACKREETDHTPVWFMRQAGRYQPEYRKIKEKYSIVDICKIPEVCTEVTMLPIQQFDLDAAIVFSDIMIPLEPMGINFEYKAGVGPVIDNPIKNVADVNKLRPIDPERDLAYTGQALQMLKERLNVPCLGFVGAPYTLASYMIEGGPSKNYILIKQLMRDKGDAWHLLMDRLTTAMTEYCLFQLRSGAAAVQLFDSWVGNLSRDEYMKYVFPYMKQMVSEIKAISDAPVIMFGVNTAHLLEDFKATGVDVVGFDWKTDLTSNWDRIGRDIAVQGNLDPTLLFSEWDQVEEKATSILEEMRGNKGFIFNLGHGILPKTPVENVRNLARLVRNFK